MRHFRNSRRVADHRLRRAADLHRAPRSWSADGHLKFSTSIRSLTEASVLVYRTVRPSGEAVITDDGTTLPRLRATLVEVPVAKSKNCNRAWSEGRST